jgi:phage-related protein
LTFPETVRREAGHQLDPVQHVLMPEDWKPMPSVGTGVREVRIRGQAGAFRVIHLANRPEAVYVLQPAKLNFVLGKSWCSPGQRVSVACCEPIP